MLGKVKQQLLLQSVTKSDILKETLINTFRGFEESFGSSAAVFRGLETHRFALISVSLIKKYTEGRLPYDDLRKLVSKV